jgi:hypothetical protein
MPEKDIVIADLKNRLSKEILSIEEESELFEK